MDNKRPRWRGAELPKDWDYSVPSLSAVPVVQIAARSIFLDAIALLDLALELVAIACDLIKIIVSEFAPLLFDLALYLFPVSFNAIPIHLFPPG